MCSPVGHAIAALGVGATQGKADLTLCYVLFCLFGGLAADLDFLVGWYLGDINGYHHLGSHSLMAAGCYGLGAGLLYFFISGNVGKARAWGVSGGLVYLSHLVLDMISRDESSPIGMQLFWPASPVFYASPVFVFPKFLHETEDGDMTGMVAGLLNWHNLFAISVELLVLLPVTIYLVMRSTRQGTKK